MSGTPAAITTFFFLLCLTACAGHPSTDGAPASASRATYSAEPVPREEPRSRYGNSPYYTVFGKTYRVLETNYGFREQGVASWYGNKFHGNLTANRETYDMYAMTAAHKTLPLPTYVEVRNLKNGKRVIVRVNDRGPFVDKRIIDLSYAAASKLDMVRDGTSLVEIRAISFDPPPSGQRAAVPDPVAKPPAEPVRPGDSTVYLQVGAFGDRDNAARRYRMLKANGIEQAFVHQETREGQAPDSDPSIYRVRIGPIDGVEQYDQVVGELNRMGIAETHLVTE